ncbi:MAG: class I SAM-dependent methyltransferase [Planctomycetota bacterium]
MSLKEKLRVFNPQVGRSNQSSRERWLEDAIALIPPGSRLLDAGAGTQQYKRFCSHLNYVSQDFAQYDGQGDATALQTGDFDYGELDIVSDITDIPEPDESFDAVMCVEVLEHVPDPPAALAEMARLLKANGTMIITAPFCSLTHFSPYHFATGFNRYWYETHLESNGLEIEELTPNGNYFEYIAQEVKRIRPTAKSYTPTKPRMYEKLAMNIVNRMLHRFSQKDQGSSQLLCYGYHVCARKRAASQSAAA